MNGAMRAHISSTLRKLGIECGGRVGAYTYLHELELASLNNVHVESAIDSTDELLQVVRHSLDSGLREGVVVWNAVVAGERGDGGDRELGSVRNVCK